MRVIHELAAQRDGRCERRQWKLATAHALLGAASSTLRRWWSFVEHRRARRVQLALDVESRVNAMGLGRCGEVMRLWRAVAFHQRLERKHAAEALGATVAYPAQYARAEPSRWPQAFAHRRENAPDTIGDMRQLK